jgi:N-acylneuraminate cytidylyltransferase
VEEKRDPVIAFIPVRGGSKGIPKKNIKLIAGRPLLYWTLDAAVHCELIDRIVVATDDAAIAAAAHAYGNDRVTVFARGPHTATDTASTESAMLEYAAANHFEHMVLIQATSPLTQAKHLTEGLRHYLAQDADSLVTVVRQKRFLWEAQADGGMTPLNYDPVARPRRQDHAGILVENGAFYVTRRDILLARSSRLGGKIVAYEMPEETYYEIDEASDWLILEALLKRRDARKPASLRDIKLFLTDVDGVLTDAGMYYTEHGDELKKFNTRDGKGLELLRHHGIKTGIITGENTRIVANRAKKLQVDFLFQGAQDKLPVLQKILEDTGISPSEVAYIGDDLNDLDVLRSVGFAAAPADAAERVREHVHYVCRARGGEGCLREVSDLILSSQ